MKYQYSINNASRGRSIAIVDSESRSVHDLGGGRLGGIVHIVASLIRLRQKTRKNYCQSCLSKTIPHRSELPVSKSKLNVAAVEPEPIVTGQRYSESFWMFSVETSPVSLPLSS
jgi:hypothetical protein